MLSGSERIRTPRRRRWIVGLVATAALLIAAPFAGGHIERASYWPNPAPERVGGVKTGGKVPQVRKLFTALDRKPPGRTRVVCQGRSSFRMLEKAVGKARKRGVLVRPSKKRNKISKESAKRLIAFNRRLLAHCHFNSIQAAVTASHNNDRVVIMPGVYTEPNSRAQPTDDPRCAPLKQVNDKSNPGAVSYAYQMACPNDQNLIAVMGRANGTGSDPQPPLTDRHNIPNVGPCIRCNLQIEGSGPGADDVVIDAGRVESGNGPPADSAKDVGIRADRADGFVLRKVTVRHAKEHGIYILESDGYEIDNFKTFYNGEYGVLTFVEDHGLMQKCDAAGSGDAGLYPGAGADTGEQTIEPKQRLSQTIRSCDMHHNTLGYSGTDGNAVWVHHNNFYDNAEGFSTDVFTAPGHPGFPADSDLIEKNNFYSNNFNPYVPGSDVVPTEPVPVGTGLWIAGGNNNTIRNNHFWDNWRRGSMLFAVPDVFVCSDPSKQVPGCNPTSGASGTSFRNHYYNNSMGRDLKGRVKPNGVDFWWDQGGVNAPNPNSGDCWYNNTGKDGTAASVTTDPSAPGSLPSNCAAANAPGNFNQVGELLTCSTVAFGDPSCPWFTTPPKPNP
jgi:hypothetical protein